jgi:site-specific DNA-methyltransferase (adenine-specific)/site-specific DNA-methyltransferase (cytosine-N4-specific)
MKIDTVICGDCCNIIPQLENKSIRACITSPPYALQRKKLYEGIAPEDYPQWTVEWMKPLKDKLTDDGSILIVIRPSIKNGELSDYVLKTRLALRQDGWVECEELIWYKPDAPPLGSCSRPRRTWESILWFSKTGNPYINLKACGNKKSTRTGGFAGSTRFGEGGDSPIAKNQCREFKSGTSRCTDIFVAYVGEIQKGVQHPAMYPPTLTDQLVQTFTTEEDVVLDPFVGSGTTLISARKYNRHWIGIDNKPEYVEMAKHI